MPTEDLKKILAENKGPYAFLFSFVAAVIALAQLGPPQIDALKQVWPLVSSPAGLMLLSTPTLWSIRYIFGGAFRTYIEEQRASTRVDQQIHDKLEQIAEQFKQLLADHLDDKLSFAREITRVNDRFDAVESQIHTVLKAIEKRREYHHGDTDKFTKEK